MQGVPEIAIASLRAFGSVAVALSGGVDSAVLAALAVEALGRGSVIALSAKTELVPCEEMEAAAETARLLGVSHEVTEARVLDLPEVAGNTHARCYACKARMFDSLLEVAAKRGAGTLVDGTNADDLREWRPGMKAAAERGVVHPLADAGLSKKDIRLLARERGLPLWSRPAQTCLATRFPFGEKLEAADLERVHNAEVAVAAVLIQEGYLDVRVRQHGSLARIELPEGAMAAALRPLVRRDLVARLNGLGYEQVALDLAGRMSPSSGYACERTRGWNVK